jgi:putative ABC transport system permease protein
MRTRALMRPGALAYLYRRRLRVHGVQELLAGAGVAVAVALVFAVTVAGSSIAGSAGQLVHAVVGPATLQLRARDQNGFSERLLARVEGLAGVKQAAPLLEQTATIRMPDGRHVTVDVAGTDVSLAVLDGLAHTLPIAALSAGAIGLSQASANELGIASASTASGDGVGVRVQMRGASSALRVSAVLGAEEFGVLSRSLVAVMPLARLQQLAGLEGRVTQILVQSQPGAEAEVRRGLQRVAGGTLTVAAADQDVTLLKQALRPSNQASAFFSAVSALLGFLFAFCAMLLTVPERRQAIADMRLIGTRRTALAQMVVLQGAVLGLAASLVGIGAGYLLAIGALHPSSAYLARAFTLGGGTVIGTRPVVVALVGGILATCLASTVALADLRRGRALDAVYRERGAPGNRVSRRVALRMALSALGLVAAMIVVVAIWPSLALVGSAVLALAAVLLVPVVFTGVLWLAGAVAARFQGLTLLPVALSSLRATTLRSLALAGTGAVALFGSVALGGARQDLLRGIRGYAHNYTVGEPIWVGSPYDNQATVDFRPDSLAGRVARAPGVAGVATFQGSFLDLGNRRVWVIAWPASIEPRLLDGQVLHGSQAAAMARVREGGWVTISEQIAAERHLRVGQELALPTPTGTRQLRVAATTTNFGWPPGAILMSTGEYERAWDTTAATGLGVRIQPGANVQSVRTAVQRQLGASSGLEVLTAEARLERIEASASEGLGQLGEISALLILAAILAMAAALGASIWQRRSSLAELRLAGVKAARLRRVLLIESVLMLAAGCLTGVVAGIYGEQVIDGYLRQVTGFPVSALTLSGRPLEILAIVLAGTLAIIAVPGWIASRVPPKLALESD